MTRYRVSLLKRLVDSYGRRFKTLQGSFELEAANTTDAELVAERQFERQRQVSDWHSFADLVEVEPCGEGSTHRRNGPAKAAPGDK
jgi:hypothetical protein